MEKDKLNILHLFKKSLPLTSGDCIRNDYILKFQKKIFNPVALTSFNFSSEFSNMKKGFGAIRSYFFTENDIDIINGNIYYRFKKNLFQKVLTIFFLFLQKFFIKNTNLRDFFEDKIFFFIFKKRIYKIIKKHKIQIIHAHGRDNFSEIGLKIARLHKIPFIYEARGFTFRDEFKFGSILSNLKNNTFFYKYYNQHQKNLLSKADRVVTLSNSMKNEIVKKGISNEKIVIIPNGVDINKFKPQNKDVFLISHLKLEKDHILGFIGSIRFMEGIHILIQAIPKVQKEINNIKLLLIGAFDTDYYDYLQKLIKKLKLDKIIIFLGRIPHSNIIKYYSIIDIIVIPRINIKKCRIVTPIKTIEAMAQNKMVIGSNLPALKSSIVPKISGDLFEAENIENLAEVLIYYLKNKKERQKIQESARNYVNENFSWESIILKYKELYNEILNF